MELDVVGVATDSPALDQTVDVRLVGRGELDGGNRVVGEDLDDRGVVLAGRLFRGWAELGHTVVVAEGPPCQGNCTGRGHLESVASGNAADRAAVEAEALVKRRQKMAEEKIAAAERSAIADVRARAASAATAAAAALIKQTHDAKADKGLVDEAIGKLAH